MRIFLTGLSGFFGLNAALCLGPRHEVWGSYLSHPIEIPGARTVCLDLANSRAVKEILCDIKPDVVIHAAAASAVDACEIDPTMARTLNVDASSAVARAAKAAGAALVHISTDQIFDGKESCYKETDDPHPINVYGRMKWEGEQAALAIAPDAVIIRANFFGWGLRHKPSLTDWALERLRGSLRVPGFTDVHFTPILVNDLIERIEGLLACKATGVFHVAGADRLSKYEFLCLIAQTFGLSTDLVQPSSVQVLHLRAPRPQDMSLNGQKTAMLLKSSLPGVRQGLARLQRLEQEKWPEMLREMLVQSKQATTK